MSPCWVTGPSEQPDLASVKDLRSTSQNAYQSIIDVDKVKPCTVPVRDHALRSTCLAPPAQSQCIAADPIARLADPFSGSPTSETLLAYTSKPSWTQRSRDGDTSSQPVGRATSKRRIHSAKPCPRVRTVSAIRTQWTCPRRMGWTESPRRTTLTLSISSGRRVCWTGGGRCWLFPPSDSAAQASRPLAHVDLLDVDEIDALQADVYQSNDTPCRRVSDRGTSCRGVSDQCATRSVENHFITSCFVVSHPPASGRVWSSGYPH